MRPWLDAHLHVHAVEWEQAGELPAHVFGEFATSGMLLAALPAPLPVARLMQLGITTLLDGVLPVEEFDALHGHIFQDEMLHCGYRAGGGW